MFLGIFLLRQWELNMFTHGSLGTVFLLCSPSPFLPFSVVVSMMAALGPG